MRIKWKIFNEQIMPVMTYTYGMDTWTLNKAAMYTLAVAQRKMERIMY